MTLLLRAGTGALCAAVLGVAFSACYTAGQGTPPPMKAFYFPTGLTVSRGGNVLYAANSDFDLQWNGGTLQSLDLYKIRHDAAALVQANLTRAPAPPAGIPWVSSEGGPGPGWTPNCLDQPPPTTGYGLGVQLQQGCAPAVDVSQYIFDSAIIGAFATALQLSHDGRRIFAPISGNATVTWADVAYDDPNGATPTPGNQGAFAPMQIDCGVRTNSRCDSLHQTGNDPYSPGNTRNATMPGEPFGMAQTEDGAALAVTSETDTKTSLLTTGLGMFSQLARGYPAGTPTMQFVLDGLPMGGVGIAAVPHDPYAVRRCEDVGDQQPCIRQAFLQANRNTNEVDLIRYYDDDGSSLLRPFYAKERAYSLASNYQGTDFRGIVIDPTPRLACQATAVTTADRIACGQIPARVFIASRTPASLVISSLGGTVQGQYDPDLLVTTGLIPLPAGPSNVYLAPVVVPDSPDGAPRYALRVFVVLYDSNAIAVIDPNHAPPIVEGYIPTGPGPDAMAFDPFSLSDVATNAVVPVDPRQPPSLALRRYRFAYVGIFTQSYMQAVDLDFSATKGETFERVVFNLGAPSIPLGQQQGPQL